ncbi:DUF1217 domain-containing protein [Oceaniglobus indicus]|uniref:DUF1217 domain-containing protein n=1 Tax=Oceaniglobus indicus TaxID=2047749 RepID=UPI000C1A35B0|nr:DUF1217 domain-containing protein [Oceaniglobus indicus]
MTYTPVAPLSGSAGWQFLQRTRATQQETFVASPRLSRNAEAFREKITGITTAEQLVNDRQLLEVALGAFGLDEDINNRFFIEKMLSDNPADPRSLPNRMSDKRYLALNKAFGFGDAIGPRTGFPDFAERIIASYEDRQFELAVGDVNPTMRLALGFERDLGNITGRTLSDDAKWFTVMATGPVRAVFETALSIPQSVGALDLDRQLVEFRTRAQNLFGVSEVSDFAAPEFQDRLMQRFLNQEQLNTSTFDGTPRSAALAILQARPLFG